MKPLHLLIVIAVLGVAGVAILLMQSEDGGRQGARRGADRARDARPAAERTVDDGEEAAADSTIAPGSLSLTLSVRAPGGAPAGGASIRLRDPMGTTSERAADDDGTLALRDVAPGVYAIQARKGAAVGAAVVNLDEETGEQVIQLHDALTVRGRVLDAKGDPIAGATVDAIRGKAGMNRVDFTDIFRRIGEPDDLVATAGTDDAGRYELLLPGPDTYALRASSARHGQEHRTSRAFVRDVEGADFHLFPAAFVSGRVVDEDGRPIAGAHVFLVDTMTVFAGNAPKLEAIADAQGRFALAATAGMGTSDMGGVLLTARAPGYAARIDPRIQVPAEGVEVVMERGATLTMRTMDASMPGRPAADVSVAVVFGDGFAQGRSNRDGYVEVRHLPTGSGARSRQKMAILTSKEFVAQMLQLGDREIVDGVLDVGTVEMERGGVVRGTVRDKESSEPVAGAIVQAMGGLEGQLAMMGGSVVRSDGEGRFELRGVPLKANALLGRHPDYLVDPGMNPMVFRGVGGASRGATLFPEGETEIEKDVLLTPGAVVRGFVRDADGEPVAGATVTVQLSRERAFMAMFMGGPPKVYSEADGSFALKPVARGETLTLVATHAEFGPSKPLQTDPSAEVTLTLTAPLDVVGVVRDEAGKPVQGVRVQLGTAAARPSRGLPGMPEAGDARPGVTDEEGRFVIRNAPRGDRMIEYVHPHFLPRSDPIRIGSGARHDVGVVTLDRGLSITGTVVDEDGKPVIDARLTASEPEEAMSSGPGVERRPGRGRVQDRTDGEGKFGFFGLSPGSFRITVARDGLYAESTTVAAGTADVRIVMVEAGELRGIVRAAGKPVSGAQINARFEGSTDSWAQTGADGRFHLDRLPPGRPFHLTIRHNGYKTLELAAAAASPSEQTFDLDEGRVIEGIVVDEAGRPVAGAMVQTTPTWRTARTGADGRFRIGGFEEVNVTVRLRESGRGFIEGDATVLAPGENRVRLVAVVGKTISGTVLGADGKPTSMVSLEARDADGNQVASTWVSDPEGSFEIRGLPPGTYTIRARNFSVGREVRESEPVDVEGVAAGSTGVTIRLGE